MKTHWYAFGWVALLALTFTFQSCEKEEEANDLVAALADDAQFSILVDAVEAAGLTAALSDETASLTLFAPTNTAFENFLAVNNFTILSDIPANLLADVLTYHVVGSTVKSTDLATGYVNTLSEFAPNEPLSLYVNVDNGVQLSGGVNVIAADEEVDNGVIHTIDAVMVPNNLVNFALADPNFSILVAALTRADLSIDFVSVLNGDGPFTVFAPTNQAFVDLLASNNEWNALEDIPQATLEAVLQYHVVSGANVRAGDLSDGQTVTPLAGGSFNIDLSGSTPMIQAGSNSANIIATDVQGTNGVIHAIDTVILP